MIHSSPACTTLSDSNMAAVARNDWCVFVGTQVGDVITNAVKDVLGSDVNTTTPLFDAGVTSTDAVSEAHGGRGVDGWRGRVLAVFMGCMLPLLHLTRVCLRATCIPCRRFGWPAPLAET